MNRGGLSQAAVQVRPVEDSDQPVWDELARSSDDAWLSHCWVWNAQIEEGVRGGARRSLFVLKDGEAVGILPLHLRVAQRGPLSRRVMYSNYWASGGLALRNDIVGDDRRACFDAAIAAVHAQCRRDGVGKLVLIQPPLAWRNLRRETDSRAWMRGLFVDRSTTALVLRLEGRTEADVWRSMEGRARTKARKAERAGVRVVWPEGSAALDSFYSLHVATYRRTGAPPQARTYFEALLATGFLRVAFAEREGRRIAGAIVAVYGDRALFFASASLDEGLRLGANNLLQWHVARWLLEKGTVAYELGMLPDTGSSPSSKIASIARFLRSFGGEELLALRAEYVYQPAREAALSFIKSALERFGSPIADLRPD